MILAGDYLAASAIYGQPVPASLYPVVSDGVVAFFARIDPETWEVHVHAPDGVRGRAAADAFRAILAWWWEGWRGTRLVTVTRRSNRKACMMAVHLGFRRVLTQSALWPDGVTRETVLYERMRPCDA